MSNKPNFRKKREQDVLVNYCIMKRNGDDADIRTAARGLMDYIHGHAIYYHVDPIMKDGELLFSIIGFQIDQGKFKQAMSAELRMHNCVMRSSKDLPVPKKVVQESTAMPKI